MPDNHTNSSAVQDQKPKGIERKKAIYVFIVFLMLCLFLLLIIPVISEYFLNIQAYDLYNPNILKIIYAILGLMIAIATFGIIKGASAAFEGTLPSWFQSNKFTLGGPAAAWAIFFFLLTYGLDPYSNLTVHIFKGNGVFWRPSDGLLDLRLTSRLGSISAPESNPAQFIYLPKRESRKLRVGSELWKTDRVEPANCLEKDGSIKKSCEGIDLYISKRELCIDERKIGFKRVGTFNVDKVINGLMRTFNTGHSNIEAILDPSPKAQGIIHNKSMEFNIDASNLSLCPVYAQIEKQFNANFGSERIKIFMSCKQIKIIAQTEKYPEGDYKPCIQD